MPLWTRCSFAIALEAAATVILARTTLRRSARSEDLAFLVLIVLLGGFVLLDELFGAYATEAVRRNLLLFVAFLYLVVRADR